LRFKSYRVQNMAEAMERIGAELGPDAVIVEARPVSRAGLFGRLFPQGFEVTAAVDESRSLEREVAALSATLRHLLAESSDPLAKLRQRLLDAGVAAEAVARLTTGEGAPADEAALRRRLEELLGAPQPILLRDDRCRVVALVGPTGVGKTTTLAKLAARFAITEGVRVGLVTADTYRIAAVQQLHTYADILGVPMAVASYPAEMAAAVDHLRDRDLVLIDTGGRSHQNDMHMAELKALLEAARPDETHLVLSLASDPLAAARQAEAFRRVGVHKVLLTKRDEAERVGLAVNVAQAGIGPFSYVTMGQRVPEDIEPFSPRPFVRSL
jgi:flagellar biosynthesis protein FlhF